jgi:hypothetical protein
MIDPRKHVNHTTRRYLHALLTSLSVCSVLCVAQPSRVEAANGDSAQPLSSGAKPTAPDALII